MALLCQKSSCSSRAKSLARTRVLPNAISFKSKIREEPFRRLSGKSVATILQTKALVKVLPTVRTNLFLRTWTRGQTSPRLYNYSQSNRATAIDYRSTGEQSIFPAGPFEDHVVSPMILTLEFAGIAILVPFTPSVL
jgi:hypothetical protein